MEPYRFTDAFSDVLEVRAHPDYPGTAIIDVDPDNSAVDVHVPAHRLAVVVTAMYEKAGQPAPDLPDIYDEAEVERLAKLVHYAEYGVIGSPSAVHRQMARTLLAHGVRLPEVTP